MIKELYGLISQSGKYWHIIQADEKGVIYPPIFGEGNFPFDKYPNLPVIDAIGMEREQINEKIISVHNKYKIKEEVLKLTEEDIKDGIVLITVDEYIQKIKETGMKVRKGEKI